MYYFSSYINGKDNGGFVTDDANDAKKRKGHRGFQKDDANYPRLVPSICENYNKFKMLFVRYIKSKFLKLMK